MYIHIVSIYIKCICRQLDLHIYVICTCFHILVHGMVHRTEQTQMHKKEICNTHCLDAIKKQQYRRYAIPYTIYYVCVYVCVIIKACER